MRSDTLPELIESGHTAVEQRAAIRRGLDTLGTAVEQAHTERVLEVRDGLGYDRDGNRQALGGLGHAARLRDGNEHMQIPQLDAVSDPVCPLHVCLLGKSLSGM